jgi:hypothetical protein
MRNNKRGWLSNGQKELFARIMVWIGLLGIILNSAILIWQVQVFIQLNNQFNFFSRLI